MSQNAESILLTQKGGFNFDNCSRNDFLQRTGMKMPGSMKTGTTIVGIVYKNGVVLGADTRATEGPIVCDKNCEKIHHISKKIWCCGAGTSADTENVTGLISSQLELHRLATGSEPRVVTACTRLKQHLYKYQGHVSAALVLGGVDATGAHLYTVYPHGSTDRLPYATMGSGSLAAMAEFEAHYKDDMDEKEAIDLVDRAIQAGIFNDLGSGGQVDIVVLDQDVEEPKILRNYRADINKRMYKRKAGYAFPKGTTEWLKDTEKILKNTVAVTDVSGDAMDES
jgi:20S proteasome subunit beta 2